MSRGILGSVAEVYFGPIRITVAGVVIKLSFPKCIFRRILGGVAEASVPPGKKKKEKAFELERLAFPEVCRLLEHRRHPERIQSEYSETKPVLTATRTLTPSSKLSSRSRLQRLSFKSVSNLEKPDLCTQLWVPLIISWNVFGELFIPELFRFLTFSLNFWIGGGIF